MTAGLNNKGFLDTKECWKLWTELGGLGAASDELLRRGKINPKTGNAPTKSGIEKAAFTWAMQNQDEARKDLEFAWARDGVVLTDEEWNKFITNASRLVYYERPKKFEKFISQHGLEQYV